MTDMKDRERGFEAHFAHDQALEFKAAARRNRQLGHWAGELMGLSGEALDAYALTVIRSDLKEVGDDDVFAKVMADLAEKGVDILPSAVRTKMDALYHDALETLKAGG
jgi:hypothetical protein